MTTSKHLRKAARDARLREGSIGVPEKVRRRQRGTCIDWLYQNGHLRNRARSTSNSLIAQLLLENFPYGNMRDSISKEQNYRVIARTYGIIEKKDLLVNLSNRKKPEEGTINVYFVGDQKKKVVKIGVAKDVVRRCASIQSGFPLPLYVFRVIRNAGVEMERMLHHKYRKLRSYGEWFYVKGELADFLRDCEPIPYRTLDKDGD